MKIELRFLETEIRADPDGTLRVSGYVNETEKHSQVLGVGKKFVEKIQKGAFDRALKRATKDIDFLSEHDTKKILSSTKNGSLELYEDEKGLFMSAIITPTTYGKDTYELIKAGILQHMSFGFKTLKDTWKVLSNNLYERTIIELELLEVSVVKTPCYSNSSISARGIDVIEDIEVPAEIVKEKEMEEKLLKELRSFYETSKRVVDLLEPVFSTRAMDEETAKEDVEEARAEDAPENTEVEEKALDEDGKVDNPEVDETSDDIDDTPSDEADDDPKDDDPSDDETRTDEKSDENTELEKDSSDSPSEEGPKEDNQSDEQRSEDKIDLSKFRDILASLKQ